MDDLISRLMAIHALGEEPEVWTDDDEYSKGMLAQWQYDKRAIESLSSLEHVVKRKRGEWKHYGDKEWLRDDGKPVFILCSECDNYVLNNASSNWNYCPNCGAYMRKEVK